MSEQSSTSTQYSGQCLCGKVKVRAPSLKPYVGACHCDMCRRWASGPLFAVHGGQDVSFEGEEHVAVYSSSEWAERGFCKCCGSNLFYRLKANQLHYLSAGLFSQDENFVFERQVFIDAKPAYYCFANKTKDLTAEEVFARYNANQ